MAKKALTELMSLEVCDSLLSTTSLVTGKEMFSGLENYNYKNDLSNKLNKCVSFAQVAYKILKTSTLFYTKLNWSHADAKFIVY